MKPLRSGISAAQVAGRDMHYFTNETQPYFRNRGLYLATPTRFFVGNPFTRDQLAELTDEMKEHLSEASVSYTDAIPLTTRPSELEYRQPFEEAYLRPGPNIRNWSNRGTYPHVSFVPTGPSEMSQFVKYGRGSYAHVRRYSMRIDGFTSIRTPLSGGEIWTRPLLFHGKSLQINYATSGAGSVRVEVLDTDRTPVKEHTIRDAIRHVGDAINQPVLWTKGKRLLMPSGQPFRLRFVLHDADLFSLQFV